MSRTACAWIPQFELNARRAATPELRGEAVIIAEVSSIRATVIDASEEAMLYGICPRMSMVNARALCPEALIVPPDPALMRKVAAKLLEALYELSPVVGKDGQGAFFIDLTGVARLHPDEAVLGQAIRSAIAEHALPSTVAIADQPVSAWIAARSVDVEAEESQRVVIVAPGDDQPFLASLPLAVIPMPEQIARLCRVLGFETVESLQRLPKGALCRRFGRAGDELTQRVFARSQEVFKIEIPQLPEVAELHLDQPTTALDLLIFLHKSVLDRLLKQVAVQRRSIAALELSLRLADSDRSEVEHCFRPARPTLESRPLLELITLHLQNAALPAAVEVIRLSAKEVCVASKRQLSLFERQEQLSSEALCLALARLSAAFGKEAVVRPELADSYRPEARLRWVPIVEPTAPKRERGASPSASAASLLSAVGSQAMINVLQLFDPPTPMLAFNTRRFRLRGDARERRIQKLRGPFLLNGHWWEKRGFERQYLLVFTVDAEVCLVFCEQRRWYLHAYLD